MISEQPTKESFVELCRLLYEKHLVCGVGGNISARFSDNIITTPSGISLRDMTIDDIVVVSPDGKVLEGKDKPTKEFSMHSRIFESRDDVNVICHIHGSYLIAASAKMTPGDSSLPPLTPGFCYFAYPLAMLPFYVPGTDELANAVADHFADPKTMALLEEVIENWSFICVCKKL